MYLCARFGHSAPDRVGGVCGQRDRDFVDFSKMNSTSNAKNTNMVFITI